MAHYIYNTAIILYLTSYFGQFCKTNCFYIDVRHGELQFKREITNNADTGKYSKQKLLGKLVNSKEKEILL